METESSRAQVEACLDRIATRDSEVRSVCTVAPDALAQADALDRELAAGGPRGPLHGVPVLVKDNIDTAGLTTTAGSLALAAANPPAQDADLVRRLRAAGMVVVGKTNLSEWANFRDDESISGWSGHGGLTRNPHALDRSAGGSSSGSGAAVAAGLARFAVGTETDGSIACPAAFNGCVGLKPTVGTVSTSGVVPISWSMDSPGPMTTTVAEAAALLTVMAGTGTDHASPAVEGRLTGKRIGVPRAPWWGYSPDADAAGEEALRLLSEAGAVIVDDVDLGALADFGWEDELAVMLAEFPVGLAAYLATRTGDGVPRDLADVIDFNRRHAEVELSRFGQSLLERALAVPGPDTADYAAARARCVEVSRGGIDRALGELGLDALVTPSYAPAPLIEQATSAEGEAAVAEDADGGCSTPTAMAGYPLLTVPVRLAAGLPVAVSFWGTAGSEPGLLEIGAGLEASRDRELGPLQAPGFAASRSS